MGGRLCINSVRHGRFQGAGGDPGTDNDDEELTGRKGNQASRLSNPVKVLVRRRPWWQSKKVSRNHHLLFEEVGNLDHDLVDCDVR